MICIRLVLISTAMAALMVSCATSRVEYLDATIAPAMAEPGSVVVVGIVAQDSTCQLSDNERRAILSHLESKLSQKRKHQRAIGHGTFERQVGRARSVGSGYTGALTYALTSRQIEKAKQMGADFALVVSLKDNNTWCDVDESCTHHEEPVYDREGNKVDCRHWTEYTTTSFARRSVRADYLLYDLSTGKKVWACSSEHQESHSRSACSDHCYPPAPPHPTPPCLADVMENMSASAVRKYPR